MKKKLVVSLIAATAILSASVGAYAASTIKLVVNGKLASAETKVINGTTYVPLRAAAELLGADVKYDAATSTVNITSAGTATTPQSNLKTYNVDVTITNGPMTMKVSKVTLDPTYKEYSFSGSAQPAIILDVAVENTSNDKLTWFVDQSELVLNTKEQIEKTLYSEKSISSDFNGKVVKTGKIVFPTTSKFSDISSIRLLAKYVLDADYKRVADEKETDIILK